MKKNKSRKINKTLLITDIILILIILLAGGYLFVAHQQNYWPFEPEVNEVIQEEETVVEETTVEPETTNPNNQNTQNEQEKTEPEQADDGFVEGKTPVQYEGQTDNSNAEFNNEQFRIPEGEL